MALQDWETHSTRLDWIMVYTTVDTVYVRMTVCVCCFVCHFSLCGRRGFAHLPAIVFSLPLPPSFCLVCLTVVTHLCPVSLPPLCLSVRSGETCWPPWSPHPSLLHDVKTEAEFWKGQKLLAVSKFHHVHSHCGLKWLAKVHLCDILEIIQFTEINEDVELAKTL